MAGAQLSLFFVLILIYAADRFYWCCVFVCCNSSSVFELYAGLTRKLTRLCARLRVAWFATVICCFLLSVAAEAAQEGNSRENVETLLLLCCVGLCFYVSSLSDVSTTGVFVRRVPGSDGPKLIQACAVLYSNHRWRCQTIALILFRLDGLKRTLFVLVCADCYNINETPVFARSSVSLGV